MATPVETAILVEMTALDKTVLEEATRKCVSIAVSQAISDTIVVTTHK
jgi:hypothetical protein